MILDFISAEKVSMDNDLQKNKNITLIENSLDEKEDEFLDESEEEKEFLEKNALHVKRIKKKVQTKAQKKKKKGR